MDWTKAKTILIIAFLFTNLFLATSLLRGQSRQEAAAVSDDYLNQTLQFLEDQGVMLETPLPRTIPSLAPVTVEYRFFPFPETADRFLGTDWEYSTQNAYQSDRGRLTIINEKLLVFQPAMRRQPLPNMNEESVRAASREFLEAYDLYPVGLQLSQVYVGMVPEYHEEPLHKLVYEQTYQGRFIGESYVHVYLNQQGVVAVEALLLEDPAGIEQTGSPRRMIDAPEALLRKLDDILARQRGNGPIIISRIEAGVYFTLPQDPLTRWESVASGTAVPAWKIVLKNGDTFYQEAF